MLDLKRKNITKMLIFRKCGGTSPRCIRKELFCDGRINCAVSNESPEGNCS